MTFNGGNDATAFEATYDSIVNNCTAYNISNAAYDNWEGASGATVSNSTAYLTGSGSYGILFTGVGTSSDDLRTASGNTAGTNAIYTANPLEKQFRDIHVATQHAAAFPLHYESAGKVLLGLRPTEPGW